LFKLRIIRIFDNRKQTEKYVPIKGAKYQPTLTEERKAQIKKRVMLKIKCIHAFTNGYKWHSNRTDVKYVPTLTQERKRKILKSVLFKLRIIRIFDNRK